MEKFDIIQVIGDASCKAATHASEFLWAEPACAPSEVWNMGLLIALTAIGILALRIIHSWRKHRRESGYY